MLPGPPDVNVYRELPSRGRRDAMADAIDRLRVDGRLPPSAVVVVQLPFWTALAERLRETLRLADRLRLHGRPLGLLDELRVDAAGGRAHHRRRPIWSWSPPTCSTRKSGRRPGGPR